MAYNENIARSQDVLRTQSPIHTILDEEGLATLVSTLKEELGSSGGGDSGSGSGGDSNHTTASVSKTGNTATITVTDKNGKVTTATITDGANGKDGAQGANGKDGITPTIKIGTVTTLDSTESATVTNSGTDTEVVLNFGIPKGTKGDKGDKGDSGTGGGSGTTDYDSLTNKPDLSVYATKDDLTTHYMNKTDLASTYQPKGDYATTTDMTSALSKKADTDTLASYATKTDIAEFITKKVADATYQPKGDYLTDTDLTSYATQSYVQNYVQQELGVIENGTY